MPHPPGLFQSCGTVGFICVASDAATQFIEIVYNNYVKDSQKDHPLQGFEDPEPEEHESTPLLEALRENWDWQRIFRAKITGIFFGGPIVFTGQHMLSHASLATTLLVGHGLLNPLYHAGYFTIHTSLQNNAFDGETMALIKKRFRQDYLDTQMGAWSIFPATTIITTLFLPHNAIGSTLTGAVVGGWSAHLSHTINSGTLLDDGASDSSGTFWDPQNGPSLSLSKPEMKASPEEEVSFGVKIRFSVDDRAVLQIKCQHGTLIAPQSKSVGMVGCGTDRLIMRGTCIAIQDVIESLVYVCDASYVGVDTLVCTLLSEPEAGSHPRIYDQRQQILNISEEVPTTPAGSDDELAEEWDPKKEAPWGKSMGGSRGCPAGCIVM